MITLACCITASNCYHLGMVVVPPVRVHNEFLVISRMADVCAVGACFGGL
jgi:hypothetical protein